MTVDLSYNRNGVCYGVEIVVIKGNLKLIIINDEYVNFNVRDFIIFIILNFFIICI